MHPVNSRVSHLQEDDIECIRCQFAIYDKRIHGKKAHHEAYLTLFSISIPIFNSRLNHPEQARRKIRKKEHHVLQYRTAPSPFLRQLLLDEEGTQMRQLPDAGTAENDELDNHPANDTGVGGLGLVSELGLAFTLEDLLATDVVQAVVQVLDTGGDVGNGVFVGALNLAARANDHVELELDAAVGGRRREPRGAARRGRGQEANLVVAGLVGDEVELARRGASLGDNAVVVVEYFIDGDVNLQALVLLPCVGAVIPLLGGVGS